MIAIVVTWNRKELLRRCLQALEAQSTPVGSVLVIDNSCTDGTLDMLRADFPSVQVHSMGKNTGGAGGFAEGIRRAQQEDWDFLWLMDDDAWATPSALEQLLVGYSDTIPAPSFVCSRVVDETMETVNGPALLALEPNTSWDRYLTSGRLPLLACSFVSALIPFGNSKQAGIPLAHYFLWMDDCEYTLRLSERGAGWYIATSLVYHPRPLGLRNPDILLETAPNRIHLYKHFFSNDFETRVRHSNRFGKRWIVPYFRYIVKHYWLLLIRREWKKIATLTHGLSLGVWRGTHWWISRTR